MNRPALLSPFVFLLCWALVGFSSCAKNEPKETAFIPAAIQAKFAGYTTCNCEPFAQEYRWKDQTIYLFSCAGPACNCITLYYNEAGEPINLSEGYSPDDFRRESSFVREIWRCKP